MAQLAHLLLAVCALRAAVVARAPPPSIPVAVLLDEPNPEIKANEVAQPEVPRPLVDLENPGPPQRQEHETQNPETYLELAAKLFSVKENIERTQNILRQGLQGVSDDINSWISNSGQLSLIQQNIQNLRDSFTNQIQKLNETLQGFVEPSTSPPAEPSSAEDQVKRDFQKIESRLQILEDNFKRGVNTLSEGVQLVASLKPSESLRQSAPASPETPSQPAAPAAPVNPPQNILVQYVEGFQTTVLSGINNVTQAIGNFFNRTQSAVTAAPPAVLADTPAADSGTQRPPFFQNWGTNINQFFGQAQNPLTFFQEIIQRPFGNLWPNSSGTSATGQPAAGSSAAAAAAQPAGSAAAAGSNAVPVKLTAPEPAAEAQPAAAEPAPATLPPAPIGPIRQILNNIPVVQRIQSQIQASSANTDKPRDSVKSENVENGSAKPDPEEKGGILLVGKPPHNNNNHSGDNSDIGSGLKPAEPSEDVPNVSSLAEAPAKTDSVV